MLNGSTSMESAIDIIVGPTVEVGCLVYFGGSSGDTDGSWGVVDNGGLWSVLSKHTGSNKCHYESHTGRDAIGELLGIDSTSKVAVRYNNKFSSATAGADCLLEPWQDQPGDNTSPNCTVWFVRS